MSSSVDSGYSVRFRRYRHRGHGSRGGGVSVLNLWFFHRMDHQA
jgi:hypothetical protein